MWGGKTVRFETVFETVYSLKSYEINTKVECHGETQPFLPLAFRETCEEIFSKSESNSMEKPIVPPPETIPEAQTDAYLLNGHVFTNKQYYNEIYN